MASLKLNSNNTSALGILIKTQVLTKCKAPPKSTSFAGQTAVITGSNVGIGLETCRQMLQRGLSHLVMGVRSISKGEVAASVLRASSNGAEIEVWELDMASYDSIQAFVKRCETLLRLDMVILNAPVLNPEFKLCPTGHEETFQVNYLSTALLAILLLPTLKSRGPRGSASRLTIVSSNSGLTSRFVNRYVVPLIPSFDDPNRWGPFMERYTTTKALVLMLTHKLSEFARAEDVIINTVDPGLVGGSSLHREFSGIAAAVFGMLKTIAARSMEEGAWTYLDAVAVQGKESHGGFLVNFQVHPLHTMMYTAEGRKKMEQLWEETIQDLAVAHVRDLLRSMQSSE